MLDAILRFGGDVPGSADRPEFGKNHFLQAHRAHPYLGQVNGGLGGLKAGKFQLVAQEFE
jgi:hypothetical protein